ncbi:MAG TPA: hypothetical protein VIR38_03315, partial [Thalassobaculum sp.]
MTTRRTRLCLVAGLAAALAGTLGACAEIGETMRQAADNVSAAFEPRDEPPPPPTSYCYRTLGKVNCYSQPLPAEEAN